MIKIHKLNHKCIMYRKIPKAYAKVRPFYILYTQSLLLIISLQNNTQFLSKWHHGLVCNLNYFIIFVF